MDARTYLSLYCTQHANLYLIVNDGSFIKDYATIPNYTIDLNFISLHKYIHLTTNKKHLNN